MKALTIIIILLLSIKSYSQEIGIKGGFLYSNIQELNGWINPVGGVFIASKGDLYFNGEINYKNITGQTIVPVFDSNNNRTGQDVNEYSFKYIEFPILAGFRKGKFYINTGLIPAYLFSSNLNRSKIFGAEEFNISTCISPGFMADETISLEARFSSSINGIYSSDLNYLSFSLLLGYRFKK
jgi:hypothetical protein